MRKKDRELLASVKKRKRLPFHGKVTGGAARRRPDRRAAGGAVAQPPAATVRPAGALPGDVEPISPNAPNAPASGGVRQKFRGGGLVAAAESIKRRGTEGSLHKAMGIPEGEKIGPGRLASEKAKAKRTGNTKLMRKVTFAQNINK